jgi:transcriptional regulator with XRE-family HTH domain
MVDSSRSDEVNSSPGFARALGRTIKVARADVGMDRRTLARQAEISYSYLTEIENGNRPPSSKVLARIADALNKRMSQLVQEAEERRESGTLERSRSEDYGLRFAMKEGNRGDWDESEAELSSSERPEARLEPPSQHRYLMQPSYRDPSRHLRAALAELERLLPALSPEDVDRLVDFARRMAR